MLYTHILIFMMLNLLKIMLLPCTCKLIFLKNNLYLRFQVTYNRVMSNHRSVTKPKDVKYKRINKAKSKSLEELRGRLRNWVEKGNKIAISLDQSYA